jgi:dihydroxy-acid dehydratase
LLKTGDIITIDIQKRTIDANVSEIEWKQRKDQWRAPPLKATSGTLFKFIKNTTNASKGCTTDE